MLRLPLGIRCQHHLIVPLALLKKKTYKVDTGFGKNRGWKLHKNGESPKNGNRFPGPHVRVFFFGGV